MSVVIGTAPVMHGFPCLRRCTSRQTLSALSTPCCPCLACCLAACPAKPLRAQQKRHCNACLSGVPCGVQPTTTRRRAACRRRFPASPSATARPCSSPECRANAAGPVAKTPVATPAAPIQRRTNCICTPSILVFCKALCGAWPPITPRVNPGESISVAGDQCEIADRAVGDWRV